MLSSLNMEKIREAAGVLGEVVRDTDMILSQNLLPESDASDALKPRELLLKTENLQVTGSFKVRGAYYKMSLMSESEKAKGVIACSAGNHAQGVALAAQRAGISATIFIPSVAPLFKIEATKRMGAKIELIDGVYDDAYKAAVEACDKTGRVFVHPFDDADVIAGQGTVGLEIMSQAPNLDAVIVPIGGGGLISGVAFAVKAINPDCKVYGVQASGADSMYHSFKSRELLKIPHVNTFADGIAVKSPGELTFAMCREYVDDIVTVTDDEITTAILGLMEHHKLVAEGAGAVAVAAAMHDKLDLKDKRVCAIVSGGNIDINILSRVISRGLLTTGRFTELTIEMLDKPGQLKEVSAVVADMGANVVKVVHDPSGRNTDIAGCILHLSLETKNREHFREIRRALQDKGYKIV
jgi:threonine dehydratase